jgi:hypothetical protein
VFRLVFVFIITVFSFVACDLTQIFGSEDEDEPNTEALLESFTFKIEDNASLNTTIDAFVDQESQIVTARLPSGVVNTEEPLVAEAVLSGGATITPDPSVARAYKDDVFFTITAEDGGESNTYVVQSQVSSGAASAALYGFHFDTANADNGELSSDLHALIGGGEIYIIFPYAVLQGSSLYLTPTLDLPEGATYTPAGSQNFKTPLSFVVTGVDGEVETYVVSIGVDPNDF